MDDYRDTIAALNARIEELERELHDARDAHASGPLRCPHCRREMIIGTAAARSPLGHKTDVIHIDFRRKDGEAVETVDRARGPNADGFCEDCSTIVLKGRFAD